MKTFKAKNVLESFKFAWEGLKYNFTTQRNYRTHIFFVFLVVFLGIYFEVNPVEWCLIVLCFSNVLATEMINTSIETLSDNFIGSNFNTLAKIIKDSAAGAVFITAICTGIVGAIIFIPKMIPRILHLFY